MPVKKKLRAAKKKLRSVKKKLYDNFQQGDLVFGLNSYLKSVHETLRQQGFHHYYCNSLNDSVVPLIVSDSPSCITLNKEKKAHYDFLFKHKEYLRREHGKPILTSAFKPNISAAFRRACKLLLIHRSPERKYTAHVALGDIDWSAVCDKTNQGVTNSELRAVYRDITRHGNHPNILFYNKNLEQTKKLPWKSKENKSIFEQYELARTAKLNG